MYVYSIANIILNSSNNYHVEMNEFTYHIIYLYKLSP
jgi:hypothetical protein